MQIQEELETLLSQNWLPVLDEEHTLRVRRYVGRTKTGVYYPTYRNIVISSERTGTFVHEYMHAYDHQSGSSGSEGFRPILERYRSLISAEKYSCEQSEYLSIPTEAHSRCYEMYLCRRIGKNPLLEYGDDEQGMVSDSELDRMCDAYFDRIRQNRWRL